MKKVISVLVAFTLVSCSSTTLIRTTDSAAKIYVDGAYKGVGAVSHTDTKIVGANLEVKITKKGCQDQVHMIKKTEKLDVGALIGGLFLLVPFLWVMEYDPTHDYEFSCKKA